MIVQRRPPRPNSEAKQRGKRVAVVVPTSVPEEALLAADYMILDEEITLPMFVEAIGGATLAFSVLRAKTRRDNNPIPRFDLLEFDCYDSMSTQFARLPLSVRVLRHYSLRSQASNKAQLSCWQSWIIFTSWGGDAVFSWWMTTSSATSGTCC